MKRYLRILSVFLATCLAFGGPSAALAEEPARPMVDPAINAPYQDPDFESWVRTFERPGREVYDKREAIVQATGVQAGQAMADIGAGTGLFTLMFAEEVGPEGRVYAVDISKTFVSNVVRRASENGFGNVEGVVNDQRSVKLPADSVDVAFISDTYHHFEHPLETMASLHRALRPGGSVVVIDFRKDGARGWVQGHVRANKASAIEEIESVGFELVEDRDFLASNYFLRFRKRGGTKGLSSLLLVPSPGHAESVAPPEELHYRLAYRGLLTSFIWKRLADVTFLAHPGVVAFQGLPGCRHTFTLTTEKYAFAELIRPVRYRWEGTVSRDLQTLHLIEAIDRGRGNEHEVYWFDWAAGVTERYRRREKLRAQATFIDHAPDHGGWEKDGSKPLPGFLKNYPLLDGGLAPLIHERSYDAPESRSVIDPLTMIYVLRRHDFTQGPKTMDVAADEEALPYRAVLEGRETIRQNGEEVPALRIKIVPESEKYRGKGYIDLWLRDDATRIPLRFLVDAPLGKMRIELESAQAPRRMQGEQSPGCGDQPGMRATPPFTSAAVTKQ